MAIDMQKMPELSGEAVAQGVGPYQYYRDGDGWIQPGTFGRLQDGEGTDERRFRSRGWQPLHAYGRFQSSGHLMDNPLEGLFMRGGAHEVPLAQIVANGWDRRPPTIPWCMHPEGVEHRAKFGGSHHMGRCFQKMVTVEFPQLAGHTPEDVPPCEFCDRDDLPTMKARMQHITVMHQEHIAQIRMGEKIAQALHPSTQKMMADQPYICGICNEGFSGLNALQKHVSLHREEPEST